MKIHIQHRTSYQYSAQVAFGPHQLMMRPRVSHAINLEQCALRISIPHQLRWIRDLHENNIGIVDFTGLAAELMIEANFVLDICEENPFNFVIAAEALPSVSLYLSSRDLHHPRAGKE